MKVYHMSQTLKNGDELQADYKGNTKKCEDFLSALEQGEETLYSMIVSQNMEEEHWRDYVKWCVEGIFEFVRRRKFSNIPSRLKCSYFFDELENFKTLYEAGWAQESEEERAKLRLYEVELDDECAAKLDMLAFDEAYDVMYATKNIQAVMNCAERYFSGLGTPKPIWEIMSDKRARAVKDITDYLQIT